MSTLRLVLSDERRGNARPVVGQQALYADASGVGGLSSGGQVAL